MSTRIVAAIAVLFSIVGCQSAYRGTSAAPADIDARLASVEHARLVSATDSATHPPAFRPIRPDSSPAMAGPPTWPIASPAEGRAASGGLTWTLADLAEEPVAGSDEETLIFSDASERETKYLTKQPLDSLWATIKRDVKDMPHDLWHDTKNVYGNPINLVILGSAYGGSLALQETGPDDTVEDHYTPGHHTMSRGWRNALDAYGNPGTHFAIAGAWYVLGQQLQDDKTYNVGKTLASALVINGLTTMAGQAASWDRAPNGEWGTFPSGHTSSSFCIASVMHEAYGHVVGVPLYGLAALVALERVDDRNHYFSDVMMGAVLGTLVGHSVASGRDPEFFGWKVLPWADPAGGTGVAFMKTLD